MKEWFAYDPEEGFSTWVTEAEAIAEADKALDTFRDGGEEGWDKDSVEQICWGRILGGPEKKVVATKKEGEEWPYDPAWDEIWEYDLKRIDGDRIIKP